MSLIVKAGKSAKSIAKHLIKTNQNPPMSLCRRINSTAVTDKICAMTFDDGPTASPPNPDNHNGKPLTEVILETLRDYGARATFDVIGSTSQNYPDRAGRESTAQWGGIKYDHYPDINRDELAGALNQPGLIEKILGGNHELANHGCRHIIFGPRRLVYFKRVYFQNYTEIAADLSRLHDYIKDTFGYTIKLARPPHYVDKISGGLTAYDAYAALDYQYLGASFDGAGWLPLSSYKSEVAAMHEPLKAALERDPGALCGRIIFQKDGLNMARRTPVADGLRSQLELLLRYGYRVVTVSELMNTCCFSDINDKHPVYAAARKLIDNKCCAAYSDNTVRPENPLTRGEFAMFLRGREAHSERISMLSGNKTAAAGSKSAAAGSKSATKNSGGFAGIPPAHPYAAAARMCVAGGFMELINGEFRPGAPVSAAELDKAIGKGSVEGDGTRSVSRGEVIIQISNKNV